MGFNPRVLGFVLFCVTLGLECDWNLLVSIPFLFLHLFLLKSLESVGKSSFYFCVKFVYLSIIFKLYFSWDYNNYHVIVLSKSMLILRINLYLKHLYLCTFDFQLDISYLNFENKNTKYIISLNHTNQPSS